MDRDSAAGSVPRKHPPTHRLVLTAILLLAAAIVVPPLFNISRYKRRIASSISSSMGRPVHMTTVRLHLLPLPGFEMSDFEVEEDPAFGDEPMLRSASVVASIRLSSLWRRRLEISRISLDEPSLNLVRNRQGRWNFDSILLKASQSEVAPTIQSLPGAALRFPYVVASNARINFKQGYEKSPLSFLNADVSIWLGSSEQWRLRLEAQPIRTDLDVGLSDTGLIRLDGTYHPSTGLLQAPSVLHAEWVKAPLGQISRLLTGRDMGWRGDLNVGADITSTAERTQIKARLRADGVHRLEFAPLEPLNMDASCEGSYFDSTSSLEDLACTSPIGSGNATLAGAVHSLFTQPRPDLRLHMEKVPVSAILEMIRSVRSDFAPSLTAHGTVDGDFHLAPRAGLPKNEFSVLALNGSAIGNALELTLPDLEKPLLVAQLRLAATDGTPAEQPRPAHRGRKAAKSAPTPPAEAALVLRPFSLTGAGSSPLMADGRFTSRRFTIHLAGDATVKNLTAIAKNFGLLSSVLAPLAAQGTAKINLTIRGPWLLPVPDADHPISVDTAEGTLELRDARITPDFLAAPIDLSSATAAFSGDRVAWAPLVFTYAGVSGEGALHYLIPCRDEKGCSPVFSLRFPALDGAQAEAALLGGSERRVELKDLLARFGGRARPWPLLNGTVEVGTLALSKLVLEDARASLIIDGNHVKILSLDGRALGGTLHASGALDTTASTPHYAVDAELSKVNAAEIAPLFHEKWGSGVLSLATHFDMTGYTGSELLSTATGTYRWDWTHGSLSSDSGLALSRFERWQAQGVVAQKMLTLDSSTLTPAGHAMAVTGSISFDRQLKIHLGEGTSTVLVTGTPEEPRLLDQPPRSETSRRSPRIAR